MKTPIIIAGLAALVLLSSKSETSQNKPKYDPLKSTKSGIDPFKGVAVCTDLQYKNEQGKCVNFWIDGETEEYVLIELNNQISALQDDSKICSGEFSKNDVGMTIVKNTITKLWPTISKTNLPPKGNAPEWLKKIWGRTLAVYASKICSDGELVVT